MDIDTLPVWVSDVETEGPPKSKATLLPDADTILARVPAEALKKSLGKLCNGLSSVLDNVNQVGEFQLQEFSIDVTISASGEVNLIGGIGIEGSGSITLTFARPE